MVLLHGGVFRRFLHIRIELVNDSRPPTAIAAKKDRIKWADDRRIQIVIDLLIWASLFISVTVIGLYSIVTHALGTGGLVVTPLDLQGPGLSLPGLPCK